MHHMNCTNKICSDTESSPRCHRGHWRIGNVGTGGLKKLNMVYVCSAGAHSISNSSKGTYIHCRKRTAIHSKTVNVAEHERKNMPALKSTRKNTPALKYKRKTAMALKDGQRASQRLFQFIPGMQKSNFKCIY